MPEQEIHAAHRITRHAETDPLTSAEIKVLFLLSHGVSSAETAETLVKELETIKSQVKTARYRLRAKNTIHACCEAIRRGLIP